MWGRLRRLLVGCQHVTLNAYAALMHRHRCDECGCVWAHDNGQAGNRQAHMCPRCDAGPQWDRYNGPEFETELADWN